MRVLLLAGLWLILTNGAGLLFGVFVVVPVAWVWHRLFPPTGFLVSPLRLPGFVLWFIYASLMAGIDVGRRILTPSLPLSPGLLSVPLQLPDGSPRWLLANLLSLIPGTLSVELGNNELTLHCLDTRNDTVSEVADVERRIARLFGLDIGGPREASG